MKDLQADFQHFEQTMLALCRARFNCTNRTQTLLYYALSTVSIAAGAFFSINGHNLGIVLIMLGCWALVAISQTPQRQARAIIKSLNGSYSHILYTFSSDGFTASFEKTKDVIPYDSISRLIEDREYCYILLRSGAMYILKKDATGNMHQIQKLLMQTTHLSWTANRGFHSLSFIQLLQERQKPKK